MYFAILWKNKIISLQEIQLINPINLKKVNDFIVTFDTQDISKLNQLWGIIKRGRVVDESSLETELQDTKIIWINNEDLGKQFKKQWLIKRFKLVKLWHTDLEVKQKWKELIKIDNTHYGVVDWYQNIQLYETIDFDKPWRSMQIGMMPAKLTLIMINIWLSYHFSKTQSKPTIYDPFVWSGTTWFLANYLWYDFIGSDIATKFANTNISRRKQNKFHNQDKYLDIFQHDIKTNLKNSITPSLENTKNLIIITEWWLWPIIKRNSTAKDIFLAQKQVSWIYISFLEMIKQMSITHSITTIFTIPYYIWQPNNLESDLCEKASQLWLKIDNISEIYSRPDQHIGRKIIILQ
jgi:hypothetical protein